MPQIIYLNPKYRFEQELKKAIGNEVQVNYLMPLANLHSEMRAVEAVNECLLQLKKDIGGGQ